MTITVGLDVGGAHLKVALVDDGQPIEVAQYACPLWQGLDKLDAALAEAAPLLARASRHAVTMTGELSDLFDNRAAGVAVLTDRITTEFGPDARFWIGTRGFGNAADAKAHHGDTGSTNFLATATLVSRKIEDALVIDFGSTTADIIPVIGGVPRPIGLTDAVRQTTGELVYTGHTRTAVMGIADRAPFAGAWVSLAREYLATMADIRRILGELDPAVDLHATADGRGKTFLESTTRFARMLGREPADGTTADWQNTARYIAECQMRSIHDAMLLVLSRHASAGIEQVVLAGIGSDVIKVLARRLGLRSISFAELVGASAACARHATNAAPATAVAMLLDAEVA